MIREQDRLPASRRDPRLLVIASVVALMWLVELVDTVTDGRLQRQGIVPRTLGGLDGIVWAPFLHDTFGHLLANTLPFLVLGGLVIWRGVRTWVTVSLFIVVVGGGLTWALGRSAVHVGASAVVFGYLGFLLAVGFVEKRVGAIVIGAVVGLVYGGLLWGLLPVTPGVSWEGHVFGFGAGVAAAKLFPRRPQRASAPV